MASLSAQHRFAGVATSLGQDALVLRRAVIQERLSEPFHMELSLLSENNSISFEAVVGKPISLRLDVAQNKERYFNGIINTFAQVGSDTGYAEYRATVVPALWILSRASDCRIFQKKSVPDILKSIFGDHQITFEERLHGTYQPIEFCVQYRETDLNFCSRLMEREGIYYFFKHENGKHTLVLADSQSAHQPFSGYASIDFRPYGEDTIAGEYVRDWSAAKLFLTTQYAHTDFDFTRPNNNLLRQQQTGRYSAGRQLEIYDYPGEYVDSGVGQTRAKLRMEEIAAGYETMNGLADARGIATGHRFKLGSATGVSFPHQDHFREYLVTATTHTIAVPVNDAEETGKTYQCAFSVIPQSEQFRPERVTPKPHVQGPQTAIVTGTKGEEIYTDPEGHGRVKVQFHWDRYGKADENSSCWLRVSQGGWAGKNWGFMAIPRVGQEVIVEFLEGDPDRPIVTGRVYNGASMPPYKLPDEKTKTTMKSNSTKGGQGFNEFRFEDLKGKEQVFIHAERNMDVRVKKDSLEYIGENRHLIVKKDQFESITGDKHLDVKGEQNQKIGETLSINAGQNIMEKAGMNVGTEAGQEIHLKAGMNIVIEAGMSITLKAGGGFIVVGPAGVTISGTPVLINSGGSAGSGSGINPTPPKAALEADKAITGTKNEVAARTPARKKPAQPSPMALVLKQAAKNGTPFCEKCAAAVAAAKGA